MNGHRLPFVHSLLLSGTFFFASIIDLPAQAPREDTLHINPVTVKGERISPSAPYRVTRIDSSVLEDHSFQDLGELLQERSGLQVRRYGPSGTASLSFRGTRSNETRMYWNGLPLRSPTLGQADLSMIPAFFLDDLTLHHGGGSAIDGSGGIGGSLHLRSMTERSNPWKVAMEGRTGSFGDHMGGLDLSRHKEGLSSRTRLLHRRAVNDFSYPDVSQSDRPEKTRKNAEIQRTGGMQEFDIALGNGHEFFAKAWYLSNQRSIPTPIDQVERGQEQEDEQLHSMVGWRWNDERTWLSFRSGYFFSELFYREDISGLSSETVTRSWRNRLQGKHRFKKGRGTLEGALAYESEGARSSGYEGAKGRDHVRGYLQYEKRLWERLLLQGMLQEEWVDGERLPLMPSGGFDLRITRSPRLHWMANASRTYRVPTLNDLYWEPGGNPDLRAQEGWSYESGLRALLGEGKENYRLELEATLFLLEMDDRIVWAPQNTGYWAPMNIDRSRDKGGEVAMDLGIKLHDELLLELRGDYSYVDAKVIDQVEDREEMEGQAIYVPHHRGSGTAALVWKEKNRLQYGVVYTGQRFIDRDNSRYLPAYTLQRVQFERELQLGEELLLSLGAGIRNLFDVPYHSVAWHPMPGRSFELRMRMEFIP